MNKLKLKREGDKWIQDGIITEQQLDQILLKYEQKDQSYILVLFAVLLMSIGILIFIFSDWAQVPHLSRIIIMIISMLILYLSGHHYFMRTLKVSKSKMAVDSDRRSRIYGVSFITLGYIFFGATLFLIINMYNVNLFNVWPFIIWSIIGLFLYVIYRHQAFFIVGILVNIIAQIYSGLAFSTFSISLFVIFLIGYFYYTYRIDRMLYSYLFTIGLSIHILVSTTVEVEQYYWYIFFALLVYGLGEVLWKSSLKQALMNISLLSIFIFKVYESFLIQEDYFLKEINIQAWFFVVLGAVWLMIGYSKWRQQRHLELMDLLLFLPLFFLPYAYIFIIISMFVYSLFWLIVGFQRKLDDKILLGIMTFLISTFTVYIQYAWDTLNKSLFFLIGGLLLFFLSFILERKRRSTEKQVKEDTK